MAEDYMSSAAVTSDSGSEWCPSGQEQKKSKAKSKTKSKAKSKAKKGTLKEAPNDPAPAPSPAPVFSLVLVDQQMDQSIAAPLPLSVDQVLTSSQTKEIQANGFNQQDLIIFNSNMLSQPFAFPQMANHFDGPHLPAGKCAHFLLTPAPAPSNEGLLAGDCSNMAVGIQVPNNMPVGMCIPDEFDEFERAVAAFEFNIEASLGGMPNMPNMPGSLPDVKLEPTMGDQYAPPIDQVAIAASDPKPKTSSKANTNANTNANTIPLLCLLCENLPRFSDVSHLLTHISSKGHLSRRFQLDMKSHDDDDVRFQIQQYEHWYNQNGINQLLKTRQDAKEQKKTNQLKRQRGVAKDTKSRHSSTAPETFKIEPEDSSHMSSSHLNPLNQQNVNQQVWSQDYEANVYQTPSNKQTNSEYPEPESPHTVQSEEPTETAQQAGPRTPSLKGVTYLGMGIFDAGTPDMRRMRNQRKDPSVVANMVLVSQSINDTEMVWGRKMDTLEKTRSVYDTPTDMSDEVGPEDDDDELPIKRPRASRAAPKIKPKSKAKTKAKLEESPEPSGPTTKRLTRSAARAMRGSAQAPRGGKQGGGKRASKKARRFEEDLQSDDDLVIPQPRRGLDVFQGDAADDGSMSGGMLEGVNQGGQGFDGSHFGGQSSGLPSRSAMQGLPSNRPVSSMFDCHGSQQFSLVDKENDRDIFPMQHNTNPNMQPVYFQPRQNMQSGSGNGYNPLCLQRPDPFDQVYGTQSHSPFQSINSLNYTSIHGGIGGSLHAGLNDDLGNSMMNGMNNGMANGLHSSMGHSLNHGLDSGSNNTNNTNDGSHYQPSNTSAQNNGFDVQ